MTVQSYHNWSNQKQQLDTLLWYTQTHRHKNFCFWSLSIFCISQNRTLHWSLFMMNMFVCFIYIFCRPRQETFLATLKAANKWRDKFEKMKLNDKWRDKLEKNKTAWAGRNQNYNLIQEIKHVHTIRKKRQTAFKTLWSKCCKNTI